MRSLSFDLENPFGGGIEKPFLLNAAACVSLGHYLLLTICVHLGHLHTSFHTFSQLSLHKFSHVFTGFHISHFYKSWRAL